MIGSLSVAGWRRGAAGHEWSAGTDAVLKGIFFVNCAERVEHALPSLVSGKDI